MHIKKLQIKNFKSFKDVNVFFNVDLNIFTGINNSGKTTVLEAISLWHECFTKLITQAKKSVRNYKNGDWILGPTNNKYFPFETINSIRCPFYEDMFYQRNKRNKISLIATLQNGSEELEIPFIISSSGSNYVIQLNSFSTYPHKKFNSFFNKFPNSIGIVYASPVATILSSEDFCTEPNIKDKIIQRQSFQVIRNRLYRLLQGADTTIAASFVQDLNFILYNNERVLTLFNRSNIAHDKRVLINFHTGGRDIEKDIALLGSGTLQTMEILLNLYQPGDSTKELNLILLDEPDSHIHRDIQVRLINVLRKFGVDKQIFISTHNESLIRSSDYQHVFHLSGKNTDEIKSISTQDVSKIQPHFKGIYPSQINPVIRSIGSTSGLDFINAIECDKLIFVEGEDDARVLNLLLKHQIGNRKKYMFWVMGGVGEIFENIGAYKKVFSNIKNNKSLWEKSCLVYDRDFLTDTHLSLLNDAFINKIELPAYSCKSYTFESSLLTDLNKLAVLLTKWLTIKGGNPIASEIETELQNEYFNYKTTLASRFNDKYFENTTYLYKNVKSKAKSLFGAELITQNDVQLATLVRQNNTAIMASGNHYQLMTKDDVGFVINKVVSNQTINFSIETDFIDLIKLVDKSIWFDEWDFVNTL